VCVRVCVHECVHVCVCVCVVCVLCARGKGRRILVSCCHEQDYCNGNTRITLIVRLFKVETLAVTKLSTGGRICDNDSFHTEKRYVRGVYTEPF